MTKEQSNLLKQVEQELMEFDGPATIQLTRGGIFCLIAAAQLGLRHPRYTGPSRNLAADTICQLAAQAFHDLPGCLETVQQGFDRTLDIPSEPS